MFFFFFPTLRSWEFFLIFFWGFLLVIGAADVCENLCDIADEVSFKNTISFDLKEHVLTDNYLSVLGLWWDISRSTQLKRSNASSASDYCLQKHCLW